MGLHFIKERAHFIYLLFLCFLKFYLFIYLFYSFLFLFTNVHLLNDISTSCMFNVEIKSSVIS